MLFKVELISMYNIVIRSETLFPILKGYSRRTCFLPLHSFRYYKVVFSTWTLEFDGIRRLKSK